ncbi:MAG: hypothetical protein SGARI_005676 [Bacillariaceae sp.]
MQTPKNKTLPLSPENIGKALLSSLSEFTRGLFPTASEEPFETYGAINTHEPFFEIDITKRTEENSELKLMPLFFPKTKRDNGQRTEVLLVDVRALEIHLQEQRDMNRALFEMDLTLKSCGQEKTFLFTEEVWLRALFSDAAVGDACRKAQVKSLKTKMENTYYNVLFWIDDLEDCDNASWRLNRPIHGIDVPKFMSGYYFNELEAHFLGGFCLPGSVWTLDGKLDEIFQSDAELSKTRILSILLRKTFDVKDDFREGQDYKEKRKAWLEKAYILREYS